MQSIIRDKNLKNMNLPIQKQYWLCFVMLCLTSALLYSVDTLVHETLNFQREKILQGEIWRLVTGHLMHTNFNHLILNMCGFLLLWGLHGEYYRPLQTLLLCGICAFLSSVFMLYGSDLTHYVGLSAVVHAVAAWGGIQDLKAGFKSGWILLAGIAGKVGYEQLIGGSEQVISMIEARIAIDSHMYGALAGLICALFITSPFVKQQKLSNDSSPLQ